MKYKNAQELADENGDLLNELKTQADVCPFCGAFFLSFVPMKKTDSGGWEGFKRSWAKPTLWYSFVNLFHYFVRGKFAKMNITRYKKGR